MRPGIDLSTTTRTERVVLVAGLALFVNALIPWWYRIDTGRETFLHNGGLFGWGVLSALAGFASAALVIARHLRTPATFNDHAAHAALGIAAAVALGVHAARGTQSVWIGFWVELGLAAVLGAAGIARVRERRRGWV